VPKPEIQLLICVNDRGEQAPKPSCGRRSGIEVYRALKDRVRELGLRDRVLVTRTGCMRHCSRGVTVACWPGNRWYGGVGTGDVAELLDALVADGDLEHLQMADGDWE
jgi:(2Fe-2S) ferredoxin